MADGQGGAPLKKKLFGWVQSTLGKLEQALDDKAPADKPATGPASPPPARPATGSLPGQRAPQGGSGRLPAQPGSGQLPPQGGSGRLPAQPGPTAPRAAATGQLRSGTDSLTRSGPPPAGTGSFLPPPPPQKAPEVAAAESAERMAFIIAYMKDPEGDPVFKDKQMVYKVLTEERSYQQNQIVRLVEALKGLDPEAPEAVSLNEQLDTARTRQGQLFTLLKRLTGVRGKTGGTGFIAKAAEPPPLPGEGFTPGEPPPSPEASPSPEAP
jgi:hypothetical protein